ncbi:MAG TPA: thioredoxin family protein [Ignavibacteriaceae bacterium]|jgi:peroxiredoxin|nr:thioredoxin family protein [Ignavibacteriaceae bacterium]
MFRRPAGLAIFIFAFLISVNNLNGTNLPIRTKKAENFSLKDFNGKVHSLSDYKNSKAIVLMFIATQCPVSNAYNSRMVDLYNEYSKKNVAVIGINSNKQESTEEIKDHANKYGFKFPVLKDVNNVVADKFGAGHTPEIFVLNSNFEILYHGRIDDSRDESEVETRDLAKALNEILSGKPVSNPETKAFGCTIKRING